MKNKNKLLLGIGSTIIAPLSMISIVSCEVTIDERIQSVSNQIGNKDFNNVDDKKNWEATDKNVDAITVFEEVSKSKNKTETIFKYLKLPKKSQTILNDAGTAEVEIIKCEPDTEFNIKNSGSSRLKISFKVKKGDKSSEIRYVYGSGFKSTLNRNETEVQAVIKQIKENVKAKPGIDINFVKSLKVSDDAKTYLDGLPETYVVGEAPAENIIDDNKTRVWLINKKEVDTLNPNIAKGAGLDLTFQVNKGNVSRNVEIHLDNFVSTGQLDKKEVDEKIKFVEMWNLGVNIYGSNMLATEINEGNYRSYITGIDQNQISGVELKVKKFTPNNMNGTLIIELYLIKNESVSKTISKTINGFRTAKIQDVLDVQNAVNNLGTLQIKDIKNPPYIHEVNANNIYQFVSGLPINQNPVANTSENNGVLFEVASVEIEPINGVDYDSNTIIVTMNFSKGEASQEVVRKISGFISKKQYDQDKVNSLIASVSTLPGEGVKYLIQNSTTQNDKIKPSDINLSNYTNYITGIPASNNEQGVTITVKNIIPVSTAINNDKIEITIEYKLNEIVMTRKYVISGYLTEIEYWQQRIFVEAGKNYNLTITEAGRNITIEKLNEDIANIHKYVSGLPLENNNGIKISAIAAVEKNESTAIITFIFEKNVGKLANSLGQLEDIIVKAQVNKEVSGFRTLAEQDRIDVNEVANIPFTLTITEAGRNILASEVNLENYTQFITGFPNVVNGVKLVVQAISKKPNNDEIVVVEMIFTKNGAMSNKIIKEVSGFRPIATQDAIDVEKEYQRFIDNINLTINEQGRNVLPQNVNINNVKNYVEGFPIPLNGVSLVINEVKISGENEITIKFNFAKGSSSSAIITKTVSGFRTLAEQDRIDVDTIAAQPVILAITEAGTNVHASAVTLENFNQYVIGLPASSNGVNISVVNVAPKVNNVENNILVVTIRYLKNGYQVEKQYEVIGFRTPTQSELFAEFTKNISVEISNLGKQKTAYEVTQDVLNGGKNITDYVTFIYPPGQYTISYQVFSITSNDDETQLTFEITFFDEQKGFSSRVTKTLNGFISKASKATMELNQLNEILQNSKNVDYSVVGRSYSRDFARDTNKLYDIMTLPKSTRLAKVDIRCYYDISELIVEVTIRDVVSNGFKKRSIPIYGWANPYYNVIRLQEVATEGNNYLHWIFTGQKTDIYPSWNDAKVGTWQTSWITWGETQILKDYRNNTGEWASVIEDAAYWFLENWKINHNSEDVKFKIRGTWSTNNALFDKSSLYPSWSILCEQGINIIAAVEGYKPIVGTIYVRFALKDKYWK